MLSRIDDSIGICDNFYDFACGNYKPVIPDHKVKIDELGIIQDTLQERLNEVMSAAKEAGDIEPFKILKTFYQNCMDKGMQKMIQTHIDSGRTSAGTGFIHPKSLFCRDD